MIGPYLPSRGEIEGREERGRFRAERDPDAVAEVHIDYCFPCGAGKKPTGRFPTPVQAGSGSTGPSQPLRRPERRPTLARPPEHGYPPRLRDQEQHDLDPTLSLAPKRL